MKKLSTCGSAVAEAIGAFQDVQTHGALSAENVKGMYPGDGGRLEGEDRAQWEKDRKDIDFVVKSYATPIAWRARGRVYKVKQKFSSTTSHHQGKLYLLKESEDA